MKNVPPKIWFTNKPADEMIIGAYVEPLIFAHYAKKGIDVTEDEAYDDLKASGCNLLIHTESCLNDYAKRHVVNLLKQTSKRGLSFIFRDKRLIDGKNRCILNDYDTAKEYFKTYKEFEKFSSFAGVHYVDEPGYKDWVNYAPVKKAFYETYPEGKLFYINLLQTYAPSWALSNGPVYMPEDKDWLPADPDYIKYYESYMDIVKPDLFSYDHYPIRDAFPSVEDDYFWQLHLAKKYAEQANIPIMAYIQAGSWGDRTRLPNEAEMRWQVNCAIAYNTKHIAYFSYWQPYNNPENSKGMLIDDHGNRTRQYYYAQQINKELLFQDEYFLNAGFVGYIQVGDMPSEEVPVESDRLSTFGNLKEITGGNLFIGCFDYQKDGKAYNMYYVVNNDLVNSVHETVKFGKSMDMTVLYRDTKKVVKGSEIAIDLTPGDSCIIIEEFAE